MSKNINAILNSKSKTSEPYSETHTISPEMAKKMLECNKNNRKLSRSNVSFLVGQIKQNKWRLNGESIKFSNNGELLDGQHRLMACIESEVPIQSVITFNVSADSKHTMDTGRNRTAVDVLSFTLKSHYISKIASAARLVLKIERGLFGNGAPKNLLPDNTDIIDFCKKNPAFPQFVIDSTRLHEAGDRLATAMIFTGLYWICSEIDKEKADKFFSLMATGIGLTPNCAVFAARKRLMRAKMQINNRDYRLTQKETIKLIISAWNKWIANESITRIKYTGEVPAIKKP